MTNNYQQKYANREVKSSAFTALFGEEENAAALYNALEETHDTQSGEIRFTTLEGVLFMARKNDMAFTVDDKILVLSEHQSTVNRNMPLRNTIYLGRTLEKLIPPKSLYKSRLLEIPTPEFYMFYNGKENFPMEHTMHLSDAFKVKKSEYMMELAVKIININPEMKHPILEKCPPLYEYSMFVSCIRSAVNENFTKAEAITKSIEVCRKQGWLKDFLDKHSSEVENMLFTQFNLEDAKEVWEEEARETGMERGLQEGLQKGLQEGVQKGLQEGMQKGLQKINRLNQLLAEQNRTDDIVKAATDEKYQKLLLEEFEL